MTDNSWNAEHYPAPQPSATYTGERMPIVAHPPAIVERIEANYARWTAHQCADQGHSPSDHTDPADVCTCTPSQLCPPCQARGYTNPLAGYAARIYPTPVCPWCADPSADEHGIDTDLLCRKHEAEYEGTSVAMLDRRDAAEADELFWSHH